MYTYNYVSTSINTGERLNIETYNYTFLKTVFNAGLLNRIFKEGVECWNENDGVNSLSVIFSFSSYEYEGSLALNLRLNGMNICVLTFTFSPGSPFDVPGRCVYVSRILGEKNDFDNYSKSTRHFKDNAPPAVLLKVLEAMAVFLDIKVILGVSTESQVFFKKLKYAEAFNNKYNSFWETKGGKKICKGSYLLQCPVTAKPITSIVSKHRRRTI